MARIDHVVMAVEDLGAAAKALETNYGLVAHPGGPHGDAGTANMYVPLGDDQYIELLAVTNASSRHPMVAALTRVLKDGDRLFNFALRAEDIEAEAERLAEAHLRRRDDLVRREGGWFPPHRREWTCRVANPSVVYRDHTRTRVDSRSIATVRDAA